MAKTKTGSRRRATKAANTSPAGDIDLPKTVAGELVAPARTAMLGIGKVPIPSQPLRASRARDLPAPRGERETIAAAVLAVFNAERRIGERFIDFHLNALDRELPGFAGAKDRRKLELAEAGVFEVRRIANQSRRALDPTYLGDAIDPKVALEEQAKTPGGMLMPFEWIIALSPDVEKAVAAMPTADRQDLEAVAAVVAATASPAPTIAGANKPAVEVNLAKLLRYLAQSVKGIRVMPSTAEDDLRMDKTSLQRAAKLGRERGLIERSTRSEGKRSGMAITAAGRAAAGL
jgi:hypothetical protein